MSLSIKEKKKKHHYKTATAYMTNQFCKYRGTSLSYQIRHYKKQGKF